MNNLKYYWNKKNYLFEYDEKLILYAGETGSFLSLNDEEKQYLFNFIENKIELPQNLLDKLIKIEAVSLKTERELENIRNFRVKKKQANSVLSISMCPINLKLKKTLSDKYLESIIWFCERKNQKNIRFFWNFSDLEIILPMINLLTLKLEEKGIFVYNEIVTDFYSFTENQLSKLKNLRFNNFQILLNYDILNQKDKFSDFLDYIEVIFNFYKTVFYKPIFKIICEIMEDSEEKILNLQKYFYQRYGDFFFVDFTLKLGIYECNNKLNSVIFEEQDIEKYICFDKELNNNRREYLKKVSNVFECYAQNISTFIVDWDGNVLKCWKDLGNKNKSIYDLEKGLAINTEIEYEYLMTDSYLMSKCKNCCMKNQCNGGCIHDANNFCECNLSKKIKDFYFFEKQKQKVFEI